MDPVPWSSDPVADLVRELSVILQRGNVAAVVYGCHKAGVLLRHQAPVRPAQRVGRALRAGVGVNPAEGLNGPAVPAPVDIPQEMEDV